MNRESLKILILPIAVSFILLIALPGYAFAYDTSGTTELKSEDHNSGNGVGYYEAAMYYPDDFKNDYYDLDDSGWYEGGGSDYEYDYYDWGYGDDGDWDYGGDYYYGSGDSGGDQIVSYDDWGDLAYDWEHNLGWDDFGDPWVGDQNVDIDPYAYYDWGDYDPFFLDEDGMLPEEVGGVTYDLASDAFSQPLDNKMEFMMGLAGEETPGTGLGIDVDYLGDGPNIRQLVQDALPEIRGMGGNS